MLDHYNVSTSELNETVQFYEEVLGFTNGPRPPFTFRAPGCIVRVIPCCISTTFLRPASSSDPNSGVIDHIAFGSYGFEAMKRHLTDKGVAYRVNQVPDGARWQIFFAIPTMLTRA